MSTLLIFKISTALPSPSSLKRTDIPSSLSHQDSLSHLLECGFYCDCSRWGNESQRTLPVFLLDLSLLVVVLWILPLETFLQWSVWNYALSVLDISHSFALSLMNFSFSVLFSSADVFCVSSSLPNIYNWTTHLKLDYEIQFCIFSPTFRSWMFPYLSERHHHSPSCSSLSTTLDFVSLPSYISSAIGLVKVSPYPIYDC